MTAIEELREAVASFQRFINELPAEALPGRAWGPMEVLAHLVFWLESYEAQVKRALAGEPPEPPDGRFDDLNAGAVAAASEASIFDLLQRHQASVEQLSRFAELHDPESLVLTLKKGSSFQHSLTYFMRMEAGHIREHQRILKRQREREYLSEVEELHQIVDSFCQFCRELPQADLVPQPWGPKEVLAHLVFWHELYVSEITAAVNKVPFARPEGTLKALNEMAIESNRSASLEELLSRFHSANERLLHFGRTLDPQTITLEVQSYRFTLDYALARIGSHIANHQRKLAQGAQ